MDAWYRCITEEEVVKYENWWFWQVFPKEAKVNQNFDRWIEICGYEERALGGGGGGAVSGGHNQSKVVVSQNNRLVWYKNYYKNRNVNLESNKRWCQ